MFRKLIFIITLTIVACSINEIDTQNTITTAIPKNSDLIIKFHDINKIYTQISEFKWWKELAELPIFNTNIRIIHSLNKKYNINEIFDKKTIYLSSVLVGENKSDFLFITSISDIHIKSTKLMRTINSSDNNVKNYDGIQINNLKLDIEDVENIDVFFAVHNNIFLMSFSEIIIQESIRQINTNTNLFTIDPIYQLDKNLPKYSDVNILVKTKFLEEKIGQQNIFLNSNTWSWFDVELETNSILLNGVTNRGNIEYLKNNQYSDSKKSNIENILPRHVKGFYKYQINSTLDLNEVINTIADGAHENIYHLSYNTWYPTEINVAYNNDLFVEKSYVVFKPNKKNVCLEDLENNTSLESEDYLYYQIKKIYINNMQSNNWLKKITNWEDAYYILVDNYIVLSNEKKKIKSLINNISSNQTIGQSNALTIINAKLGNKSHTAFYLNFQHHDEKWKKTFNSIVSKNIASEDYFFNSIMLLSENNEVENPTEWTVNLDYETNYKPQFVINHYNQAFEIFTQDIENNIYLINDNGALLWKKKIGNAILGDIHQIDRYKNTKLQYLFNTKDSIYLIDRNGNHVKPFPIKSNQTMSHPIALFDYDQNRNYRILATMNNELSMYNQEGNIVSGWEFLETTSTITTLPKHYQIFNKDYILISEENGTTHLLNRKGQSRVMVKDKLYRSNQIVNLITGSSLSDSKLITMNNEGDIITLYFNGTIDTLKIHDLKQHDQYIKKEKYSIIIRDEKLSFSSPENRFEYHFKTKPAKNPKVFFKNDSMIIFIRNMSENLIYTLNQKGELHGNPFFGTTDFSIYNGNSIYLIVGSSEGVVYNYKIN